MEVSPKSYSAFLNGVSCYEKMEYQNATEHFLTSLSNQKTPKVSQQQSTPLNPIQNVCSSLHLPPFSSLSNLSSCLIKTKQYQHAS
jgi:hypothetical protein